MESSRAQGKRSLINYKTEEEDDDDEEEEEEEEEDQEEEEEEDSNRSSSSLVYGEDERRKRVMMMTSNSTSNPSKRGSGAGGSTARPSCQADNCNADLSDAKQYYRRHKVCDFHAKAPSVFVAGLQQRFCQQCSRFHSPSEFDDNKRSCRRRLAGHNERRRKASSEYQSPTD